MKTAFSYSYSLIFAVLLFTGCSTSRDTADEGTEGATVILADQMTEVQQARIFLDGVDKGLSPKTIRVDRRFGFSEILFRIGKERVRLFEIEQTTSSSNYSALAFSFNGSSDGQYTKFNVEELPKKNDRYVYIPYTTAPLLITDRQYGVDILVY